MQVAGGVQQAGAASANASFQQQIAIANAKRTDQQIADARARGVEETQAVYRAGDAVIGETRAGLAANNMDLSFGSPLDTILDTSVAVERDARRTMENTRREVNDLQVQKANQLNGASAYGAEASNAKTAGLVAGVGTALGGAGDIYKYRAQAKLG